MFLTIINDSRDGNAFGRQQTRASALFGCGVATVGVRDDLEASGNLVDALDAGEGHEGVVLVNVAPRQTNGKKLGRGSVGFFGAEVAKKENGSPFGYFYYDKTLVVGSVDGITLSLVKKLGIADRINVLDIAAMGTALIEKGIISDDVARRMAATQFRSYEFLPRVAHWIAGGQPVVSVEQSLDTPDAPKAVWWIDSFGNAKTTLLPEDVSFAEGKNAETLFGSLGCFTSLKDVPDEVAGLVIGSSGIGDKRFLEIVVQGESASERFHLVSGSRVL